MKNVCPYLHPTLNISLLDTILFCQSCLNQCLKAVRQLEWLTRYLKGSKISILNCFVEMTGYFLYTFLCFIREPEKRMKYGKIKIRMQRFSLPAFRRPTFLSSILFIINVFSYPGQHNLNSNKDEVTSICIKILEYWCWSAFSLHEPVAHQSLMSVVPMNHTLNVPKQWAKLKTGLITDILQQK